jgi:1-acyl-sn-glycerol-3-phosphate acyltransferase
MSQQSMRGLVRNVLAPFRTLLTLVVGVTLTLIAAPIVIVIAKVSPTSPWIERIAHFWSRAWLLAAGCRIEIRGSENIDLSRSHVVVANHLSNLDIMASFLAVPLPIRFLAKKELFSVPILAPAMRAIGIVEVDRAARSAVHEKVNRQARELVESGRSLIIYPEGTRSRDGKLKNFKKGAFTMAIAGQIPVLPVTIHGTFQAWPPGRSLVKGGHITVVVDPPIPTIGMTKEDTGRLTAEARAIIAKRFDELAAENSTAS